MGEYLKRWLDGPLSSSVSPKTYEDYAYLCRKHAIPEIGRIKLCALTAVDLDQLYARKLASGLSPRTVGYLHSTLRVALQRAVKKRLLPYNVARDAEPPAQRQGEVKTLSREELATFFEAARGDRYEAFFVMGALSGLRPGEMLALRWVDLQLPEVSGEPGVARIRRSLSKLPSGKLLIRETTKTGRGRAVHLLPEVVAALRAHRRRQLEERMAKGTLWDEQDLVFPNARGKPTNRDNLSKRHFKPILKKAGLPLNLRLYTLRHTFATLWLESGEHPKILQEILGHSRIHTTLDVYSHALPHMQREAMGRFGERFRIQTEAHSGS